MNDPVEEVRQKAASACARYEEGLSPLLPDLFARLERAQPPFRYALRLCLRGRRRPADPSLVPLLRERLKSSSPDVRECAAFMLGRMGPKAVAATPELLVVLNEPFTEEKPKRTPPDDQPDPARYAVWALSKFPPTQEFIDALARNLRSDVPDRRNSAASYLGSIGPAARKAIPALIAALRTQLKSEVDHDDAGWSRTLWERLRRARSSPIPPSPCWSRRCDRRTRTCECKPPRRSAGSGPRAKVAIPSLKGLTKDSEAVDAYEAGGQTGRQKSARWQSSPRPVRPTSRPSDDQLAFLFLLAVAAGRCSHVTHRAVIEPREVPRCAGRTPSPRRPCRRRPSSRPSASWRGISRTSRLGWASTASPPALRISRVIVMRTPRKLDPVSLTPASSMT